MLGSSSDPRRYYAKFVLIPTMGTALFLCLVFAANYSMLGNLHYAADPETVLDILQPAHPALRNRPGAILIHGGGWITGTKSEMFFLCAPLLDNDFVVANVEYPLAATAPLPALTMM